MKNKFKASDFEKSLERTYKENVKPDKPTIETLLHHLWQASPHNLERIKKEVAKSIRQTIKEERASVIKEVLNEVWNSSIDEEEFNKIKIKLYEKLERGI